MVERYLIAIVLLATLVVPARALDGTVSNNVFLPFSTSPAANPQKCWLARGVVADVFVACEREGRFNASPPPSGHR
jgi:hypothetical protein